MANCEYEIIEKLKSEFNLTSSDIASLLNISTRTLARRKVAGFLKEREANQLHALDSLLQQTEEFFNSIEQAIQWLKKPARAFGGKTPYKYMQTEIGIKEVNKLLIQLKYGVYP